MEGKEEREGERETEGGERMEEVKRHYKGNIWA